MFSGSLRIVLLLFKILGQTKTISLYQTLNNLSSCLCRSCISLILWLDVYEYLCSMFDYFQSFRSIKQHSCRHVMMLGSPLFLLLRVDCIQPQTISLYQTLNALSPPTGSCISLIFWPNVCKYRYSMFGSLTISAHFIALMGTISNLLGKL